jgi:predicted PurR-regulated permease PerM
MFTIVCIRLRFRTPDPDCLLGRGKRDMERPLGSAWSRPTKYVVGVGLVLFGIFVLYVSRTVIPLLVVAGLLAFIVRPIIGLLHERLRLPRGLAIGLTYLAVLLLLPLASLLILSAVAQAVTFVFSIDYEAVIGRFVTVTERWMNELKAWPIPIGPLDAYVDGVIDAILAALDGASQAAQPQLPDLPDLAAQLGSALTVTFGAVAGLVGNIFSSAILLIFVFLSSIYFTLSAGRYRDAMVAALPANFQPEVMELLRRIGQVWSGFFRGQIMLMLIIGVIVWIGLMLLGVPGALSLAIIAGLLEVVPNLGPVVATIPAVVVALLQGSDTLPVNNLVLALIVIGFYVAVQQLENSIIVPRVLGEAVELPALVVMSGVLVGGSVAGILGALLATPVIATAREILFYMYRKLLGQPPFPPEKTRITHAPEKRRATQPADTAAPAPASSGPSSTATPDGE